MAWTNPESLHPAYRLIPPRRSAISQLQLRSSSATTNEIRFSVREQRFARPEMSTMADKVRRRRESQVQQARMRYAPLGAEGLTDWQDLFEGQVHQDQRIRLGNSTAALFSRLASRARPGQPTHFLVLHLSCPYVPVLRSGDRYTLRHRPLQGAGRTCRLL